MKKRSGFVGNSSSSSFIARKCDFDSTLDVAAAMLPFREFDDDDFLVQRANKLKKSAPWNSPIIFPSVNFDTHIFTVTLDDGEEVYVIDTCNNHPFDEIEGIQYMSEDLQEKIFDEKLVYQQSYYDLQKELIYREIPPTLDNEEMWCNQHFTTWVEILNSPDAGTIMCPVCYKNFIKGKNKHPIPRRKHKKIDIGNPIEVLDLYEIYIGAIRATASLDQTDNEDEKKMFEKTTRNALDDIRMALLGEE